MSKRKRASVVSYPTTLPMRLSPPGFTSLLLHPVALIHSLIPFPCPTLNPYPSTPMPPNHRRCISCRRVAPREEFWRVVRSFPSQIVMLDQGMGRSAYLCPDSACLQTAQRKDRLGRALKATVSEEIYRTLWQRLSTTATIE